MSLTGFCRNQYNEGDPIDLFLELDDASRVEKFDIDNCFIMNDVNCQSGIAFRLGDRTIDTVEEYTREIDSNSVCALT